MKTNSKRPRIAIAHDYLTQRGGAERVVLALHKIFPDAPIYTMLYDPENTFPEFANLNIVTSPLNSVSWFRKDHRLALPFLAPAATLMNVQADIVIASSSGWAHGFRSSGKKIVYCHTPARWLYSAEEYLGKGTKSGIRSVALKVLSPFLVGWDKRVASRNDQYIANSTIVRSRIQEAYGIDAPVIFPPHSLSPEQSQVEVEALRSFKRGEYLLVVSRLLPYKNVDLAIKAAREVGRKIVIVGSGPEESRLRTSLSKDAVILSNLSDAELRWVYSHAYRLIAPSLEDFGITPLEAAAWGIPTIAYRARGYLDTIKENETGVFFEELSSYSISEAITRSDEISWDSELIKSHAESFGEPRFSRQIKKVVESTHLKSLEARN